MVDLIILRLKSFVLRIGHRCLPHQIKVGSQRFLFGENKLIEKNERTSSFFLRKTREKHAVRVIDRFTFNFVTFDVSIYI